ncbi:WGR domain-containing protein [Leptospira santarosai]|uniref:WGR domain-containing protein n=1 Tax=Leptospira santarosai TaxID=28183 RepID=UPI0024AEACC7|nr:WGR domain-containing protein [Leptospira santarosai]MDI7234924.1 WGR domain-containing protein [Leptospira santarosai]
MKHHLTFKDDKSDKFWSIEVSGNSFTVTYGKTGTKNNSTRSLSTDRSAGHTQTKTFDNEEKCLKEAEKLLSEKLKKGYVEDARKPQPNPVEKWKSIVDIKDLQKSLVNAFIHLVPETPFSKLLEKVIEKTTEIEVKQETLHIKFADEREVLVAGISSDRLQMVSFGELYLGDTGTFEEDLLESTSLANNEEKLPEVAISDYADWWLYHPTLKNKRKESALCFMSHAGGNIQGPFENSVDEIFLHRLAQYLQIQELPKLETINEGGSATNFESFTLEFQKGKLELATECHGNIRSENIYCLPDQSHFVIFSIDRYEHRVFAFSPQPKETFALKEIPHQFREGKKGCKTNGNQLAILGYSNGEPVISFLEYLHQGVLTVKNTVKVNLPWKYTVSDKSAGPWTFKNDYIYMVNSVDKTCSAINFNNDTCNVFFEPDKKNDMYGEIEIGIEVVDNKIYRYTDSRVFIFDASEPETPKLLKTKKFPMEHKAFSLVMEKPEIIVFFPLRKRAVVLWDTKTDQTYDYFMGIESVMGPMVIGDELWFIMYDQKPILVCMNVISPEAPIISTFALPKLGGKTEVDDWFQINGFCVNSTDIFIFLSNNGYIHTKRPRKIL